MRKMARGQKNKKLVSKIAALLIKKHNKKNEVLFFFHSFKKQKGTEWMPFIHVGLKGTNFVLFFIH
jgi:hypothetical protein